MDSIIASPTNRVRVMVVAASGCWASELSADATARPSPSPGPIPPIAMVSPAVTMEAIAMRVILSMVVSFRCHYAIRFDSSFFTRPRCRRDVDRGEDTEYVCLHHAGQQAEQGHHDGEDERRDGQQDGEDHRAAHDVAEQADRHRQRARQFADDIERQHDEGRLGVCLLYTSPSPRD